VRQAPSDQRSATYLIDTAPTAAIASFPIQSQRCVGRGDHSWRSPRSPRAELVATGAKLRSERILTDLRTWIGLLVDWWSKLSPKARAVFVGFSDARLRVVVHHAFALRDLADLNAPLLQPRATKSYFGSCSRAVTPSAPTS
jgi:hypothetical protein